MRRMERSRTATSSAATTASHPLSSWLSGKPHRSRADSTVSQVSTPLPTGVRASRATRVRPAVTEMLPALSSPTITTLARGDMNAVETVVPKRGVNTLIPALKAAGAQDILEIPISKIVQ